MIFMLSWTKLQNNLKINKLEFGLKSLEMISE
jgi:hypothetical protein